MPWLGQVLAVGLLGIALVLLGLARLRRRPRHGRRARRLGGAAMAAAPVLALTAAGAAAWAWPAPSARSDTNLAAHEHGTAHRVGLSAAVGLPVPASAREGGRIPAAELAALEALSSSRPPLDTVPADHVHGIDDAAPTVALGPAEQQALDQQWAEALAVSQRLGSIDAARAAGYVQAAAAVPGVGEHWIKWSLVDRAFDPAAPSMLLYQQVGDTEHKRLVGLSYWASSPTEPAGFAGGQDHWHRHFGLCFENGWLMAEGIVDPSGCDGHWINGSDLWMLHAWTVPDLANSSGRFAEINRRLCPSPRGRPDIATCDPLQS